MNIEWLDGSESRIGTGKRRMVTKWVRDHHDEIHKIFHFVRDSEIEAVKIIDGKERQEGGVTVLETIEVQIFCNIMLISQSEERKQSDSEVTTKRTVQLATIEMGWKEGQDECCADHNHQGK